MPDEKEKPATDIKPAEPRGPVDVVTHQIRSLMESGKLHLPKNYSAENALKSAWITLQSVVDLSGKPALQVCDDNSVRLALFNMVLQGLTTAKDQGYFIVYGGRLFWQRSYHGDEALSKRIMPGIDSYYGVVFDGDEFEYGRSGFRQVVFKHISKLEHRDPAKIKAAYFGYFTESGEDLGCVVMSIAEIRTAWNQSKVPADKRWTAKFPIEGCIRTTCRKRSKDIWKTSDDALLLESIIDAEMEATEAAADEEAALLANKEPITQAVPALESGTQDASSDTPKAAPTEEEAQRAIGY